MLHPTVFLDVVQIDETTRVSIAVGGSKDTPPAELECVFVGQVVFVIGVEHTVGEGLTGTDAEEIAGKARAITVDVIESRTFLRRHAGAHGALDRV